MGEADRQNAELEDAKTIFEEDEHRKLCEQKPDGENGGRSKRMLESGCEKSSGEQEDKSKKRNWGSEHGDKIAKDKAEEQERELDSIDSDSSSHSVGGSDSDSEGSRTAESA